MLSAVGQTYGYVHSSAKQLIKTKIMFVLARPLIPCEYLLKSSGIFIVFAQRFRFVSKKLKLGPSNYGRPERKLYFTGLCEFEYLNNNYEIKETADSFKYKNLYLRHQIWAKREYFLVT